MSSISAAGEPYFYLPNISPKKIKFTCPLTGKSNMVKKRKKTIILINAGYEKNPHRQGHLAISLSRVICNSNALILL